MSIRTKFFMTIAIVTILISLCFFAVISPIVYSEFEEHEIMSATRKFTQVKEMLEEQLMHLGEQVKDLAASEVTNVFVASKGADQHCKNIFSDRFIYSTAIDLVLLLDTSGALLHGQVYDRDKKVLSPVLQKIPSSEISQLNLIDKDSGNKQKLFFTVLGGKPIAVASAPVRAYSDKEVLATLVIGHFYDEHQIQHLEDMFQYKIAFYTLGTLSPEVQKIVRRLQETSRSYEIKNQSHEIINGYFLIEDGQGNSAMVLELTLNRLLHKKHHDNRTFLLITIFTSTFIIGSIFYLFIEFSILRRFTRLVKDIKTIENSKTPGQRLHPASGNDEFSKVSESINYMLAANEKLEEFKTKNNMLESVATFAAGATHELSTPLSTIAVASGEMLRDLAVEQSSDTDLQEDLFIIREQVERCKYIINQIADNTVAHLGEEHTEFSIEKLISDTLNQFSKQRVERITIDIDASLGEQYLHMPFHSLCRVLRGLLRNAFNASQDGDRIFMDCREDEFNLIFSIRDQGKGMDEDTLKHAVDPFFSTKDPRNNLGLGLYLAQSLAIRFNGDLIIKSKLDAGTTVTIMFAKESIYG